MEIYTMTQRPSMPLTRACAPSALSPIAAPVASVVAVAPVAPSVEWAPISRVHQVQVQAELAQALTLIGGINSTTGFMGINVSKKRYADGGSGVPPRGRPV
jgi:hypothetical protein